MFTGIITAVGHIERIEPLGNSASHGVRLHLKVEPSYLEDVGLGDSIAIQGACMTVTQRQATQGVFAVEVSAESLDKTAGLAQPGAVNLEKALRAHDRLGGHIVTGHVDGTGHVLAFDPVGESWLLRVRAPAHLGRYIARKGSVTVNGVSLTVNAVQDDAQGCAFDINLIGHTIAHTTLGQLRPGDAANLEIDLMARYAERMLGELPQAPRAS
ncbi:MAG: riboflavin synthase [Burkholderiaceae bacterium]|jgi:riboflavin synthase